MLQGRVLLMNAGCSEVLSVISLRRAITLVFRERVVPVGFTDEEINSPIHREILGFDCLPSVVALREYLHLPFSKKVPLKRGNLMLRDKSTCQYCGYTLSRSSSTIDHIMPRSRGGKHEWKNVVLACRQCNNSKADKTPEEAGMRLLTRPHTPSRDMLFMSFLDSHEDWQPYFSMA